MVRAVRFSARRQAVQLKVGAYLTAPKSRCFSGTLAGRTRGCGLLPLIDASHPLAKAYFLNGWPGPSITLVIRAFAHANLVVSLRTKGNRNLSKMNAFDFRVTVALGSMPASVLLTEDVSLPHVPNELDKAIRARMGTRHLD